MKDDPFQKIQSFTGITDITYTFTAPPILSQEEEGVLHETTMLLLDDYVNNNLLTISSPKFHTNLFHELYQFLLIQLEYINSNDLEDMLLDIVNCSITNYFMTFIPVRSFPNTFIRRHKVCIEKMKSKLNHLRNLPQPPQRTTEWYKFRYNLLTASTAWKGLDTKSSINSLIYEKCLPLNTDKYNRVNTASPFHHGTIFEPISIAIYEQKYNTIIEDFGCIPDENYYYLGASPDGINVKEDSDRFGRMLEVKNVVSREITGIPKKDYWVQMQMQMGVCNLNECDFLETKFYQYETKEEFDNDGSFNLSSDNKMKGQFIYFIKDGKPYHEYPEIGLSKEEFTKWEDNIMVKNNNLTWNKNIYWRLEVYSCVLVLRNKKWFKLAAEKLGNVWKIIEKERVEGYQHRAPKSNKKTYSSPVLKPFSGCLININNLDNITLTDNANKCNITETDKNGNPLIRINI
tara:strand:- start:4097 stop:5476 length:1380 start_codon:yes stop_codon:yes gene_type:complete